MKIALAIILAIVAGCTKHCEPEKAKQPSPAPAVLPVEVKHKLFYFGADWCEPCRRMHADTLDNKDVKDAIASQFGIYFTIVNIDTAKTLARDFNITVVPTYMIIEDNTVTKRGVGYLNAKDFLEWLK